MFKNVCAGLLMIAFVLVLIWAGSARAEDEFTGLVCKKPEAVQSIFAVHEDKTEDTIAEMRSEIALINEKVAADVCAYRRIKAEEKEVVLTFKFRGTNIDVKRVEISAESDGTFWMWSKYDDAYIATQGLPST